MYSTIHSCLGPAVTSSLTVLCRRCILPKFWCIWMTKRKENASLHLSAIFQYLFQKNGGRNSRMWNAVSFHLQCCFLMNTVAFLGNFLKVCRSCLSVLYAGLLSHSVSGELAWYLLAEESFLFMDLLSGICCILYPSKSVLLYSLFLGADAHLVPCGAGGAC